PHGRRSTCGDDTGHLYLGVEKPGLRRRREGWRSPTLANPVSALSVRPAHSEAAPRGRGTRRTAIPKYGRRTQNDRCPLRRGVAEWEGGRHLRRCRQIAESRRFKEEYRSWQRSKWRRNGRSGRRPTRSTG